MPCMTCREIITFLADYLEGALSESKRTRFEAHLAECLDCRCYLAAYEEIIRLGRDAHAAEAPAPPPEELVRAIVAACADRRRSS